MSVDNEIEMWKRVRVILDLTAFQFSSYENPKVVVGYKSYIYVFFKLCKVDLVNRNVIFIKQNGKGKYQNSLHIRRIIFH